MNAISATEQNTRTTFNLTEYKSEEKTWEEIGIDNHRLCDDDRLLVKKLQKTEIKFFEGTDKFSVTANSLVGHVTFKAFDLVILPKFEQFHTKEEKSPLATLLAYGYNFDDWVRVGEQISPKTYLAEILVSWLLTAAQSIQRRGLFQQYLRHHKELADLRGRIDMTAWFRRGGAPSATLPCVYYQRSFDNILNQTLCAGLRCGAEIAITPKLKSQCRSLSHTFALSVTEKRLDRPMLAY